MRYKEKIAITGAFGYIGLNFISNFSKEYNINCLDKVRPKHKKIDTKNINKIIISDVSSKRNVFTFLKKRKIIFYKAGILGGPKSSNILQSKNFLKNNFEKLKVFLRYVEKFKIKKIVFDSSEQVYGYGNNNISNLTSFESYPINFYGLSKLASEKLLLGWSLKNGTSVDILRYPRIVGPDTESVLTKMINDAVNKKEILIRDKPNKRLSFIHINDVLDANKKAIKKINSGYRIFNITNDQNNISLINLAQEIREKIGNKINIKINNAKNELFEPLYIKINNKDSIKNLNWKPKINIDYVINEAIESTKIYKS